MSLRTPFFSAFGSLLSGRRAHRKMPAPDGGLNQFQSVFASHVPGGSLASTKTGANSRERLFSLEVTFWAFLFQVLSPACACREGSPISVPRYSPPPSLYVGIARCADCGSKQ